MAGPLTPEELDSTCSTPEHKKIRYFVETGTYKADTTLLAAKKYEHVFTTEIKEDLYETSRKRAQDEGVTNITFMLGDSVELLKEITPKVEEGAVFFIDAHISGHDSGWNKKQLVPALEELEVILSHKLGPSVFIVDDLRLWKENAPHDWAHITNMKIVQKFLDSGHNVTSFYESNDRFFVLTS